MKKLSSVITSFQNIGLVESAAKLNSIKYLLKQASADFSSEVQVLGDLLQIIDYFYGKDPNTLASDQIFLPAYSMETSNKFINFNQYPLTDYSKQEIYSIGLTDYLKNYINMYMMNKIEDLRGVDQKRYKRAIDLLEEVASEIKTGYKKIEKPTSFDSRLRGSREISKLAIQSELGKLQTSLREATEYQLQVTRRYVPMLASEYGGTFEEGEFIKTQKTESEDLLEQITRMDEEDLNIPKEEIDAEEMEDLIITDDVEFPLDQLFDKSEPSKPKSKNKPKNPKKPKKKPPEKKQDRPLEPAGTQSPLSNLLKKLKEEENTPSIDGDFEDDEDILKTLTSSLKIASNEQRNLSILSNLELDFEKIRQPIDRKYAEKLQMPVEEMLARLKLNQFLDLQTSKSASNNYIIRQAQANKKPIDSIEEPGSGKEFSRIDKVIRDIINKKFGITEVRDPNNPKKEFHLYTAREVLTGWKILQEEIAIRYEALLKTLVRKYLSLNSQQKEQDVDAKVKEQEFKLAREKLIEEETSRVDRIAINGLSDAIKLLRE